MMVLNRPCPLCGTACQVETPRHGLRHFLCETCREIVIDARDEAHITGRLKKLRDDYSAEARKCPEGSVYRITVERLEAQIDMRGQCMPLAQALA